MRKRTLTLLLALALLIGLLPVQAAAASSEQKLAAITFDDGPSKYTDGLLDELALRGVVVTFFMQGCNAERYPDVVRKAYEAGHQIASHTYNHPQLTKLSDEEIQNQLNATISILDTATGTSNSYMLRPPYGSCNDRVLAQIGTPAIIWSVDTLDWQSRNADAVYRHIVNDTKDGSIVLLHDLYSTSVSGALRGIDTLLEQGYELVTVDELLRRRGYTVTDGTRYYSAPAGTTLPGIAQPAITAEDVVGGRRITLTADEGAAIYYTTDGTAPTSQSPVYTGPFLLNGAATVKAFAARTLNGGRSRVSEATFDLPRAQPPQITLQDGQVVISSDGEVRFTLDGTVPEPNAARYTGPFPITAGTVVRAVTEQPGYSTSLPSSLLYSELGNLFSDVQPKDWFYPSADSVVSQGIMTASGTVFSPEAPATRRELVSVLYNLAGQPDGGEEAIAFPDVSVNDPARKAIAWAIEQGVLTGFDDGTIRPDESVTREQLAVMICRMQTGDLREIPAALGAFTDAEDIQGYALDAVNWAVYMGLLNGDSETTLSPGGVVTRAQLAVIALRCQPLLDVPQDSPDTDTAPEE